jgi:hypothetical protein
METYTQTGGIRYGESFWWAANFTMPFATLYITRNSIELRLAFLFWRRTFVFPRSEIRAIRWKRGLFSKGVQIQHGVSGYPPFILFWTTNRPGLTQALVTLGYDVTTNSERFS